MFVGEHDIDFNNPDVLFKYYGFTDYALKSLEEGRFWFSAPSSFNDPFDCYFEALDDITIQASAPFTLEQMHRSRGLLIAPLLDASKTRQLAAFMKSRIRRLRDEAGIFCLSATPYSVLMWSHYSANHQGFCVAFERNPHNELGGESCNAVIYDDVLIGVKDQEVLYGGERILHEIVHKKATSWAYEHEWRLAYFPGPGLVHASGLHPISAKVKAVLFGWKATGENVQRMVDTLSGRDIQFARMEAIPGSFKLSIRRMN